MFAAGEPPGKPLEPETSTTEEANRPSTSDSNGEALAKQVHDSPTDAGYANPGNSAEQQQPSDSRDGDARATLASEGSNPIPFQNDGGWVPWSFNPVMFPGGPDLWNGALGGERVDGATVPQWVPVLIPVQMPLFLPLPPPDQSGQNGGFYPAHSMIPFYGPLGAAPGAPGGPKFPPPINVSMPMEGNMPPPGTSSRQQPVDQGRAPPVVGGVGVPLGLNGRMQPNVGPPLAQAGVGQVPDQRRVIRRFQVGIQLDLLLLLKLAVIVFVFNQDGSTDRLLLLLGLAGIIYLYQTGSLAPLLRWLAERAQHIMAPPQQPPARPGAQPVPAGQAREAPAANVANPAPAELADGLAAAPPVEQGENAVPAGGPAVEEPRRQPQDTFWGFVKEVQMLVVGFVTSLLPGFHPHAD